jgi:hypothetical protein
MDPMPWRVESYIGFVRPYLDDRSPYWPSLLGGVVLSLLHGVGMASYRTEMNVVASVLMGSMRCVCSC